MRQKLGVAFDNIRTQMQYESLTKEFCPSDYEVMKGLPAFMFHHMRIINVRSWWDKFRGRPIRSYWVCASCDLCEEVEV